MFCCVECIQGVSFKKNKILFLVNISRGNISFSWKKEDANRCNTLSSFFFIFFWKNLRGFRSKREINLEGIILRIENKRNLIIRFFLVLIFYLNRFLNFGISYTLCTLLFSAQFVFSKEEEMDWKREQISNLLPFLLFPW